ncbi:MAG: NAD(P)H-dependent oxidoreductase subunit E [Acidimicrobiales bacterium]
MGLSQDNFVRARQLIALYPHRRSALIPVLHLLQEQEGYLSPDGIEDVAALLELTPAEVRGTASFYDMFHLEPVGRYLVAVCTNIACMLDGAYELLEHVEESLGVHPGGTTLDGSFTLEEAECLALCGNAPCLTVNWRFFGNMAPERWDALVEDLRAGRLDAEVPPHGTLCRVQRSVGLPAGAPEARSPDKPRQTVKKAAVPPPVTTAATDAAGQPVALGTSRTTPAVASTLLLGGPPATEETGR